jgi:hypothetical protein
VIQATSDLYTAGVDVYTEDEWFGRSTLDEAVAAVEEL